MVTAIGGRSRPRRLTPPWLLAILIAVVAALCVVVGLIVFAPPGMTTGAESCQEVTSSACRPFLAALDDTLGSRATEIASIEGRPYCGKDACQMLFGGEALRLRVTFSDGSVQEFSCWRGPLEEPTCNPA